MFSGEGLRGEFLCNPTTGSCSMWYSDPGNDSKLGNIISAPDNMRLPISTELEMNCHHETQTGWRDVEYLAHVVAKEYLPLVASGSGNMNGAQFQDYSDADRRRPLPSL